MEELRDKLLTVLAQRGEEILRRKKDFNDVATEIRKKPKKIDVGMIRSRLSQIFDCLTYSDAEDFRDQFLAVEDFTVFRGVQIIVDEDIQERKEELKKNSSREMKTRRGGRLRKVA